MAGLLQNHNSHQDVSHQVSLFAGQEGRLLDFLQEMDTAFLNILDHNIAFKHLVDIISQKLSFHFTAVYLNVQDSFDYQLFYFRGGELKTDAPVLLSKLSPLYTEKESIISIDGTKTEDFQSFFAAGISHLMSVPFLFKESQTGLLITGRISEGFTVSEARFMASLGKRFTLILKGIDIFSKVEKAKKEWEATFDAIADPVLIINQQKIITRANNAAIKLFQSREDIGRINVCDVFQCDLPKEKCLVDIAFNKGENQYNQIYDKKLDRYYYTTFYPVRYGDQPAEKVVIYRQDVTLLMKAHSRNELLALALKTTRDCIIIYDTEETILFVNDAVEKTFGFKESYLIGKKFTDIFLDMIPKEHLSYIIQDSFDKGWKGELIQKTRTGQNIITSALFSPAYNSDNKLIAVLVSFRDISHEKEVQQKLLHSERLKSLGEMISGIAHELNNPLTGIVGYSELLAAKYDEENSEAYVYHPKEECLEAISTIQTQAERASRIIGNLLDFSRNREPSLDKVDINQLISDTLKLMKSHLKKNRITVKTKLLSNLPVNVADPYQLQQVFVNIINNACQAIHSIRDTGCIEILTYLYLGHIMVEFRDNGPGILPQNIKKIFDPFFTTKKTNEGTGLGLSVSYGIIKNHYGDILVKNNEMGGATFLIKLPLQKMMISKEVKQKKAIKQQKDSTYEKLQVLIADPHKSTRDLLCQIVSIMGFINADSVENQEEFFTYISQKEYNLIITDIKLLDVSDCDLNEIIAGNTSLKKAKFIFITEDSSDGLIEEEPLNTGIKYISKPFATAELMKKIKDVLDKNSCV